MLQQRYIFLIGFVLLNLLGFSQSTCNLTLSGKVEDEHDNEQLPFATIYIQEANKWAVSDTAGNYIIKDLCPGEYTIICSHVACKEIKKKLVINNDTTLSFYPEHHTQELIEVVVKANKEEEHASQTSSELSKQELENTRGKSLADALESVNGVTSFKTGPTISKTVITGMHSNRIVTVNNGVKQSDQQWGTEHATQLDPFIANKIEVVKGADAIQYGSDAIGGVVIVEPEKLPYFKNKLNGNLYLIAGTNGQQGTSAIKLKGASKKLKGLAFNAVASYNKAGDFSAPNYLLSNTGFNQQAFAGTIGYKHKKFTWENYYSYFNNETGILRSAHIGNKTDLQNAINSNTPLIINDFTYDIANPRQLVNHQIIKSKASYIFPKAGKLEFKYALQLNNRKEFDIRKLDLSATPAINIDLSTHTIDAVFNQIPTKKMHGTFGASFTYQKNKNAAEKNVSLLIPNYLSNNIGVFAIEHYQIKKVKLEAGLRFDRKHYSFVPIINSNNEVEINKHLFNNASASLGAMVPVKKKSKFRTNLATAFKAPTINELYSNGLHHGAAAIEIGDNTLISERAVKFINTLESKISKKVKTEITAYYNHINNYTYLQPEPEFTLTIRGAFPEFKYKQTTARFMGIDANINIELSKQLEWQTQVSYLNARDIDNNTHLIGIPANRMQNKLSYNLDSIAKNSSLQLNITHIGVARQHLHPSFEIVNPPASYNLFNIGASYKIPFNKTELNFGFEIENILNTEYRDYLNQFRYYAADLGRNIKLKLNYKF